MPTPSRTDWTLSAAYRRMPQPDWASTTTVSAPGAARHTPEQWAEAIFDVHSLPTWVKALFGIRAVVAAALRIPQGDASTFDITEVSTDEAIIDTPDKHLRFIAAVRAEADLLHVTTAVTFTGLVGRVYFIPVRLLHDVVTRAMMHRAVRRLGR